MNNEELMEYVGNEIKKYEERIKNLSDGYFLPNEYESHLTKDGYFKGRKDSYNNILEKLKEEDDKEELNKKKYCIKGKFYLKSGVVIEEVGKSIYNTEEEALEQIYDLQEEISKTVSLGERNIGIDNVVIIHTELAAAQFEVVKE